MLSVIGDCFLKFEFMIITRFIKGFLVNANLFDKYFFVWRYSWNSCFNRDWWLFPYLRWMGWFLMNITNFIIRVILSGWKVNGLPAWNFKYRVKFFYIIFLPQFYDGLMLRILSWIIINITKTSSWWWYTLYDDIYYMMTFIVKQFSKCPPQRKITKNMKRNISVILSDLS